MISQENDEEIKKFGSDECVAKKNWFLNLRKCFRFKRKKSKKLLKENKIDVAKFDTSNQDIEFLSGYGK